MMTLNLNNISSRVELYERAMDNTLRFALLCDGQIVEANNPLWPIIEEARAIRAASMEQAHQVQQSVSRSE